MGQLHDALTQRDRQCQGCRPLTTLPLFRQGCLELLQRSGIRVAGRTACVIGRSNIVGTPVALLLQRHDATVSVVHSRTPDPAPIVSRADIVVAAVGAAEMVKPEWIKPGAAVLDVGTNPVDVGSLLECLTSSLGSTGALRPPSAVLNVHLRGSACAWCLGAPPALPLHTACIVGFQ